MRLARFGSRPIPIESSLSLQVIRRLASGTAQTRLRAQAASEVGKAQLEAGKAQLQDRAAAMGTAGPDSAVKQRRAPLAAVAGAGVLGYLALRWWRNR